MDKTFSPSYITYAEAVGFSRFRFHRKRTASTTSSFRFHIPGCSIIQGVSFNYHQRNVRSRVAVAKFQVSVSSRNFSQVSVSEVAVSTTSLVCIMCIRRKTAVWLFLTFLGHGPAFFGENRLATLHLCAALRRKPKSTYCICITAILGLRCARHAGIRIIRSFKKSCCEWNMHRCVCITLRICADVRCWWPCSIYKICRIKCMRYAYSL